MNSSLIAGLFLFYLFPLILFHFFFFSLFFSIFLYFSLLFFIFLYFSLLFFTFLYFSLLFFTFLYSSLLFFIFLYKDGWTALLWAKEKGHEEVAKLLILRGANVIERVNPKNNFIQFITFKKIVLFTFTISLNINRLHYLIFLFSPFIISFYFSLLFFPFIFSFYFSIYFFFPLLADAGRSPRRNANAVDAGKKMLF